MNIQKNDEARKNILAGAETIYDAVKTTLGPRGRNVLIRDKFGKFTITHDGVTVAKSINLKDDPKSIGIELVKEASRKMDEVGDGTTSVTVLTYHLIKLADDLISKGENPMIVKRQLEAEIPALLEAIDKKSKKIKKTAKDVLPVATVSVGDEKLGKIVADLMAKLGYEGAIAVETTRSLGTTTKIVEGFTFDRGYMSPYFATEARVAKLKNPAVIVTKGTITDLPEYENVLTVLTEQNIRDCLIVAENVEADALSTFVLNKVKGAMNFCVVKAPGYGDDKLQNLKDICAVTGAELIDPEVGDWQAKLGFNTLGAAEQIIVTNDETVIMGGQGELVEARVDALKEQMNTAKVDQKEDIKQRIAKLNGKVGIIKVGGATETQAEETKYRIDDAVAAVKAALKGGVVAGGGVTLRDLSGPYIVGKNFDDDFFEDDKTKTTEEKVHTMLGVALCMPYSVLLENSGIESTNSAHKDGFGINIVSGKTVNMLEDGIIDPTTVTKEVVRNAITTACLAITVGGAIVESQLSHDEMMQLMNAGQ